MTVQIALRISDDLAAAVDRLCDEDPESPTRSDVLRKAIEVYVGEKRRTATDAAIVEAYTRLPQSTPDEWGSLADSQRASSALVAARLDEEDGGW